MTSAPPLSCVNLATKCGPNKADSCCTSQSVKGGTYFRGYDGVTFLDQSFAATISDFRLDKYEVTVGRFRKFKAAWDSGYRPNPGDGKHVHVNAGKGVSNSGVEGGYETGWNAAYSSYVAPTDANLACDATYKTWTPSPGGNENQPITCTNWYEMYAFCIWDGGYLPTFAEYNYAAAGGHFQRVYPWSMPSTSAKIDCTYASYYNDRAATYTCFIPGEPAIREVGSFSPKGDGFFGHADLAGNVGEWGLDSTPLSGGIFAACGDCAYLSPESNRVSLGGGFGSRDVDLFAAGGPPPATPDTHGSGLGARFARLPLP